MVIAAIAAAELAIVVAALRMRVEMDPGRGFLGARAAEVVWTLLPALLLAAMAGLSYQVLQNA